MQIGFMLVNKNDETRNFIIVSDRAKLGIILPNEFAGLKLSKDDLKLTSNGKNIPFDVLSNMPPYNKIDYLESTFLLSKKDGKFSNGVYVLSIKNKNSIYIDFKILLREEIYGPWSY